MALSVAPTDDLMPVVFLLHNDASPTWMLLGLLSPGRLSAE